MDKFNKTQILLLCLSLGSWYFDWTGTKWTTKTTTDVKGTYSQFRLHTRDLCNFSHMWFTIGWTEEDEDSIDGCSTCYCWMRASNGGTAAQSMPNYYAFTCYSERRRRTRTVWHVKAGIIPRRVLLYDTQQPTNDSIPFGVKWVARVDCTTQFDLNLCDLSP